VSQEPLPDNEEEAAKAEHEALRNALSDFGGSEISSPSPTKN
jgi:hypothetical protein